MWGKRGTLHQKQVYSPSESGQAILEYVLLLAFVVAMSALVVTGIMGGVDRGILVFGATLEKDLKTGRMPSGAWVEDH